MDDRQKGFTLIELLIVIGIIGFLAAAILVAVDPVKRIQQSRDTKRWSEVDAILNAILKNQVDAKAVFDGGDGSGGGNLIISSDDLGGTNPYAQIIIDNATPGTADTTTINCTTAADWASTATHGDCPDADTAGYTLNATAGACMADLSQLAPGYLASIPTDPGTNYHTGTTGYYIHRNASDRITIGSCDGEQEAINVRR